MRTICYKIYIIYHKGDIMNSIKNQEMLLTKFDYDININIKVGKKNGLESNVARAVCF